MNFKRFLIKDQLTFMQTALTVVFIGLAIQSFREGNLIGLAVDSVLAGLYLGLLCGRRIAIAEIRRTHALVSHQHDYIKALVERTNSQDEFIRELESKGEMQEKLISIQKAYTDQLEKEKVTSS